ncbi:LacI family DNA-binding transcriptional regulator [Sporosalibacterium faouarense]|uniref:LacI family DNA-binding transcriptional regulator n=1 Tax=Sporosalibacterium faouarense TaxID=516123 RepID=UPI00141C9FFD|nr:LacI family DNA-binding transcriptional regulator [Sporosalibacterium faouarense]MTI48590.1 LacI family transcriptional regulator [Bacillota bacterium]
MTATIKDVAKSAGVSISTVSRVINNSKPVSPEIKRKVLEVIKELNYRPNEIARTLVTKKSFLIGVIVTDIGNSDVTEMVRGIEEIGKMYGYDILLCSTYGDKKMEERYMHLLKMKQVEGIILISNDPNEDIDNLLTEHDIPFVCLNRFFNIRNHSTVSIDNFEATYEMTKYLFELNHQKVKYIMHKESSDSDDESVERIKFNGYKKAVEEYSSVIDVAYAKGREIKDGYEVAISCDFNEVTAVFCSSDKLAIGVMNYFYDNGIKIPDDISVSGYGDINLASIFRPKLSTVREPFYDIGAVAIRRIIKELKGEEITNKDIVLPHKVLSRESCRKRK